jgi:hypothetical protein
MLSTQKAMVNFIVDIDGWPRWPILPLKRKNEKASFGMDMGVITVGNLTTVLLTDMFSLPRSQEEYDSMDKVEYNTINEMILDGWEVD